MFLTKYILETKVGLRYGIYLYFFANIHPRGIILGWRQSVAGSETMIFAGFLRVGGSGVVNPLCKNGSAHLYAESVYGKKIRYALTRCQKLREEGRDDTPGLGHGAVCFCPEIHRQYQSLRPDNLRLWIEGQESDLLCPVLSTFSTFPVFHRQCWRPNDPIEYILSFCLSYRRPPGCE